MDPKAPNLKQLLIDILNTINPYWDLAEGFLTIVQNTENDNLVKYLLIEIQNGIKSIKSKRTRENIKRKIKEMTEENDRKDKQDKEDADEFLDNFIKSI